MRHIRIASRASKLALVQADYIGDLLQNLLHNVEISIVKISTKGDRNKSDFLYKSRSIGFFTCEVEKALLLGRADIAVHRLKDLPTTPASSLIVAAIPKRDSPADALVASGRVASIEDLPAGATVGTSSLRRIAQLKHRREDLKCIPLRGNVETRVDKVLNGQIDAVVVACAGLNRFIPAPAQGALAVQIRTDDSELAKLIRQIDDQPTRTAVETERAVLAAMHGGCSIPLGVYSHISGDTITIDAIISDVQGKRCIKRSHTDHISKTKTCAEQIAQELLSAGGQEILDQIRNTRKSPNR